MDKTIDIYVNGSYLRKNHNRAGIQGEGNVTIMHIIFDESWAELAKKVTFWDSRGENPVERTLTADLLVDISNSLLEYNVPIPAEPLVHEGDMTFIIDGYAGGKRKRSVQDTLMVDAAMIADDASEPVDPTPTQAEQLQEQIEELLPIIQADKLAAENAAERAADMAEQAAIVIDNGNRLINVAISNAESHANKAKGYADEVNGRIDEAIEIVNTSAEIANRAANSAIEANKSAEEAKSSAESIAIDEAYMEGVVNEAAGKVNEAKGYAEQAKMYSEMAKENIEGDFVTNTEFEEAINNLKDVETTSDKVILSDVAADSLNFSEEKTMDDALEVIAGALNELYENMENPNIDPDDYLPRDGSKPMNGMLKFENGTGIIGVDYKQIFLAVMDDVFASGYGSRMLTLLNAKYGKGNVADALVLTDMAEDGTPTEYKIYGEHNKPTAADTGALPIIDARSANYDMDTILKGGRHAQIYETSSTTLGTPYAKGKTALAASTIFSYSNSVDYGFQCAFLSGGLMMFRKLSKGTISEWDSGFLPATTTAADVGAINQKTVYYPASTNKSADDLMDGLALVAISSTLNSELVTALGDTFAYVMTTMYSEDRRSQVAWTYGAATPRIAVRHVKSNGAWTDWKSPVYKDECLTSAGGTMTGNLIIKKTAPEFTMQHTTTNRYLNVFVSSDGNVYFRNAVDANNRTALYLQPETTDNLERLLRLQKMVGGTATYYNVYGQHNKPSGSYTGNGNSTTRTINVGGSGILAISNSSNAHVLFATEKGTRYANGESTVIYSGTTFIDGVLKVATADSTLNADGVTYYYQVL